MLMDEPFRPARCANARRSHEAIGLGDRVVLMSARPGRIIRVDKVAMSRPRDVFRIHDSGEFRALYDTIWEELECQVRNQKGDARQ